MKEGLAPDKKLLLKMQKQTKQYGERGPPALSKIMKRERELTVEKSHPWANYRPLLWEECSTGKELLRAPWQDGKRWNAYQLPFQKKMGGQYGEERRD